MPLGQRKEAHAAGVFVIGLSIFGICRCRARRRRREGYTLRVETLYIHVMTRRAHRRKDEKSIRGLR